MIILFYETAVSIGYYLLIYETNVFIGFVVHLNWVLAHYCINEL